MDTIGEVIKGLTDVPIALLAAVLGLLLWKRHPSRREWANLFLLIAPAGLMGAAVHTFVFSSLAEKLIWTVLYAILYEIIRRFGRLMVAKITGEEQSERSLVRIAEGALYAVSLGVLFSSGGWDIYLLVVFMVLIFVRVTVCLFRHPKAPTLTKVLMGLLLMPIVLQAISELLPDGLAVAAEHTLLIAGLCVAYRLARE